MTLSKTRKTSFTNKPYIYIYIYTHTHTHIYISDFALFHTLKQLIWVNDPENWLKYWTTAVPPFLSAMVVGVPKQEIKDQANGNRMEGVISPSPQWLLSALLHTMAARPGPARSNETGLRQPAQRTPPLFSQATEVREKRGTKQLQDVFRVLGVYR